jgi:dienelactone hydrolase
MLKKLITTVSFVTCTLAHAQVGTDPNIDKYNIPKTFADATVHVPGSFFTKSVTSVSVDKPMPTVLLMHGCGGIQQHEQTWAGILKGLGYIVVMPNSYADNRPMNCDPRTQTPNLRLVPVNTLRPAEVVYATEQLRKMSWVDQKNLFLMGHSEGGVAAAYAPELGFKGVIISGFICHNGVKANPTTPVLAIGWSQDPYFKNWDFQCKDRWGDRPNGEQLVLEGVGHPTAWNGQAVNAVTRFLTRYTN